MSISNQTNKVFGTGNGITKNFDFDFKIFNASDLEVYLVAVDGTATGPLTLNIDYTVYINPVAEGGTVSFTVAPSSVQKTFIRRIEPYTQSLVLATEGGLPAKQIENQLDLQMMTIIQLSEAVDRCIQLPVTSVISSVITSVDTNLANAAAASAAAAVSSASAAAASASAAAASAASIPAVDTDGTLAANSNSKIATQKAVKTYADTKLSSGFTDRGDATGYDFILSGLTTNGSYYPLDLSSIVPVGTKAVLLNVRITGTSANIEFSQNGNSNDYNTALCYTVGGGAMSYDIVVACDILRRIRYNATNSTWSAINITIRGWWF